MHFFDYQLYDLRLTLTSLMLNTPWSLVGEVLVVDDGSTLDYLVADAKILVGKVPGARLVRNEEQLGEGRLRNEMARFARYDIVIFLTPTVVCSPGWLEPLIGLLQSEPLTLAIPHLDNVNDPVTYDYITTPDKIVTAITWSLALRVVTSHEDPSANILRSPALRGDVFAVTRDFIKKFSLYDESFGDIGAENVDLSLRTWLCGGAVKVAQCSRVGVLRLSDPLRAHSPDNVRRLVAWWMPSHKDVIYKHAKVTDDQSVASPPTNPYTSRLQCKTVDWYLDEMKAASVMQRLSPGAVHIGLLKVKSGLCARIGKDDRVDLGSCSLGSYEIFPANMVFELLDDGRVMTNGLCLTTKQTAYIQAEKCASDDSHQRYKYDSSQHLVNDWSSFCLMHVTDPEKQADNSQRQIAMAQKCSADSDGKFSTWEFIAI